MRPDVFISHASRDGADAEALCETLERRGLTAWVAPRDIPAGSSFAEAIVDAIDAVQAVVVLISQHANASKHVEREVGRASDREKPVVPVRLDDVVLTGALDYYLGECQWVDARERQWGPCVRAVAGVLGRPLAGAGGAAGPRFADLPMADREMERQSLQDSTQAMVQEGRGWVIVVEGPAGIGKTRLLEWYVDQVAGPLGLRVVWGKHSPQEAPWEGVRQALEALIGCGDAVRPAVRRPLEAALDRWGGTDDEEMAILLELLRPTGEREQAEVDAGGVRVLDCLGRVFRRAARQEPLVVVLEDIQWADEQTIRFVEHTAAALERRRVPLSLVATIRSEELDSNPALEEALGRLARYTGRSYHRFRLQRLDLDYARGLVDSALPGGLDDAQSVSELAQGNPMFLLEVLQFLHARGLVVQDGDGWRLAPGADLHEVVPERVVGLLEERVRAAGQEHPQARTVLRYAAALGDRFPLGLLSLTLERGGAELTAAELEETLEALDRAAVLRLRAGQGGWAVEFRHALYRQAVLGLPAIMGRGALARARLERTVAEAKVAFYAERVDERAAEVAAHFEAARELEQAALYHLRAARVSLRAFCCDDAIRSYASAARVQPDQERLVAERANQLPPPEDAAFPSRAVELLDRCVAAVCGGEGSAEPLWRRAVEVLTPCLSAAGARDLVEDTETVLSLLQYIAFSGPRPELWADIKACGALLLAAAEERASLARKATTLNVLGFIGDILARRAGVANDMGRFALQAGRCYERAATRCEDPPDLIIRLYEPAAFCYRRAGSHDDAVRCTREFMKLTSICSEPIRSMQQAILAEGYRDIAENLWLARGCREAREGLAEEAAEHLRRAAMVRRDEYRASQFARWAGKLADDIELRGQCDFEVPVDPSPADALLIHNQADALAADVCRQWLDAHGYTCVDTGPSDSRGIDELEAVYRLILIFGSTRAPQMARFAYLFQGHGDIWRLDVYDRERNPFYAFWRRPKFEGTGEWVMVAGSTRLDTIVAAGKFAREFTP
ncbi:MAG: ATP-binding protein [Planctomycetota bacterium]